MGRVFESLHGLTPAITQVVVQTILAGGNIVIKLAVSHGMSLSVLIAYRFVFAVGFIVPLALIVERKDKPKLTWTVVGQSFICGLLGNSLFQNLYGESLVLTSATFVSAMTNIIPAMTLILALLLRSEQLKLKTVAGKAKLIGIVTSISGAMLLIYYKGAEINVFSTKINILGSTNEHTDIHHSSSNYLLGALLAICSCLSFAINLIIQGKMMKSYPRPYLATAMTLSMGALQSTVFALYEERNWNSWKLGWNTSLLSVCYLGILSSALSSTLIMWGVRARGALYVSVFTPLMLILVAILASLLIHEKLSVGSVIGGGIIICGLYVCLWGMGKELKSPSACTTKEDFSVNSRIFQEHPEKPNSSVKETMNGLVEVKIVVPLESK